MDENKFVTYNDGRLIKKSFYKTLPFLVFTSLLDLILIKTDQILCGNFLGTEAVAAISYLSVVEIAMDALCVSINQGVLICLAKTLGKNNSKKTNSILANIFLACLILAVVEVLLMIPMISATAYLYPISETTRQMIFQYSYGLVFSSVFVLFSSTNVCVLVAFGKSRKCMLISLIGAVANVFFDIFFLAFLNLGIIGASIGSASAMFLCIIAELIWLSKIIDFREIKKCKPSIKLTWRLISTGLPFSIDSVMYVISTYVLYQVMTILCTSEMVSVYTAANFTGAITACAVIGIRKSFISLFGILYEAGDGEGAKMFFKYVVKITCFVSVVICVIFLIFPQVNLFIYGITEYNETDLLLVRLTVLAIPFSACQSIFTNLLVFFSHKKNTYYIYVVCFFVQLLLLFTALFLENKLLLYATGFIDSLVGFILSLIFMQKIKNSFFTKKNSRIFILSISTKNSMDVLKNIQKISKYFESKNIEPSKSNHIALVLEEITAYTLPKTSTKALKMLIIVTCDKKIDITVINDNPKTNILLGKEKFNSTFDNVQFLNKISKNIEQSYLVDLNYYTITIG